MSLASDLASAEVIFWSDGFVFEGFVFAGFQKLLVELRDMMELVSDMVGFSVMVD